MKKFISKRKKEHRQSLIIDNFNIESLNEKFTKRRNSISNSQDSYDSLSNLQYNHNNNRHDDYNDNDNDNDILKNYNENDILRNYNESNFNNNNIHYKQTENLKENKISNNKISNNVIKKQDNNEHVCNLCHNTQGIKDSFMILTCGHIFHIRCLVDSHYSDANKCGVIDEAYFNSRTCCVCDRQMEMEDILYIHNKFYKNTKEYIIKQDETIEKIDKQMTKLKEELRICYEYKQKLEHQREKSKQIAVTINTLM